MALLLLLFLASFIELYGLASVLYGLLLLLLLLFLASFIELCCFVWPCFFLSFAVPCFFLSFAVLYGLASFSCIFH